MRGATSRIVEAFEGVGCHPGIALMRIDAGGTWPLGLCCPMRVVKHLLVCLPICVASEQVVLGRKKNDGSTRAFVLIIYRHQWPS